MLNNSAKFAFTAVLVITTLMIGPVTFAQEVATPPSIFTDNLDLNSVPATLKLPVNKILLGDFVVELESTTLDDVQKIIGSGIIQHRGDAGDSEYWLCYSIPTKKEPQRIWFSSGEMGGDNHAILSIAAKSGAYGLKDCPELPAKFRKVSFGNALWLGNDSGTLKTLFGEPSGKSGNWWIYSYAGKSLPGPQDAPNVAYDVTATVEAEVKDGKIVTLSISQVTSY